MSMNQQLLESFVPIEKVATMSDKIMDILGTLFLYGFGISILCLLIFWVGHCIDMEVLRHNAIKRIAETPNFHDGKRYYSSQKNFKSIWKSRKFKSFDS